MARDYSTEKIRFLQELASGATVARAAKSTGVARRTWYDIRDREPAFAAEWDYALTAYKEELLGDAEKELKERALDRNDRFSHILLIFLLKRLDPAYKENYKSELKISHETIHEFDFSAEDIETAREILERNSHKEVSQD